MVRATTGVDAIEFVNLVLVWTALQQHGFFLADGAIDALSRRVRTAVGLAAVGLLTFAFMTGVYSADLIANINLPTTALLLVGVAHTATLSLFRARLTRLSTKPLAAAFTSFVTRSTMTIYLWHMPVLLAMAGTVAAVASITGTVPPAPDSAQWWLGRPIWVLLALASTAGIAMVFARVESVPSPTATSSGRRIATATGAGLLAVVLLLVLGTTVVTAAIAVALIVVALRLASKG